MKFSPSAFDAHLRDTVETFDVFCRDHLLEGLLEIDHICITCSSNTVFDATREYFEKQATYVYQSMINGRRIAIAKLSTPFPSTLGFIHFLEIADQNERRDQVDQLEHIELVPKHLSYDQLIRVLHEKGLALVQKQNSGTVTYTVSGNGIQLRISSCKIIDKIKRDEMI
jgi:predicted metalloenzyme YecM